MHLKLFLALVLSLSMTHTYAQSKKSFITYVSGIYRIALTSDSSFIFSRAICLQEKTVTGKYRVEKGIYHLDVQHRVRDSDPQDVVTLYDTAHVYFPNKTLSFPLEPTTFEIYYPMDLDVPEKLTFRDGQMWVWHPRSKSWGLWRPINYDWRE